MFQRHIKVISKSYQSRVLTDGRCQLTQHLLSSVVHLVSLAVFGEDGVFEDGLGFADDYIYLVAFVAGGEMGQEQLPDFGLEGNLRGLMSGEVAFLGSKLAKRVVEGAFEAQHIDSVNNIGETIEKACVATVGIAVGFATRECHLGIGDDGAVGHGEVGSLLDVAAVEVGEAVFVAGIFLEVEFGFGFFEEKAVGGHRVLQREGCHLAFVVLEYRLKFVGFNRVDAQLVLKARAGYGKDRVEHRLKAFGRIDVERLGAPAEVHG